MTMSQDQHLRGRREGAFADAFTSFAGLLGLAVTTGSTALLLSTTEALAIERAQALARATAECYEHYCDVTGCGDAASEARDEVGEALSDAFAFWFLRGVKEGFGAPAFLPQYDERIDYSLRRDMTGHLPPGEIWLVATSTPNPAEALKFARAAALGFPGAQLFIDERKVYHVVVTMLYDHEAEGVREQLVAERKLPARPASTPARAFSPESGPRTVCSPVRRGSSVRRRGTSDRAGSRTSPRARRIGFVPGRYGRAWARNPDRNGPSASSSAMTAWRASTTCRSTAVARWSRSPSTSRPGSSWRRSPMGCHAASTVVRSAYHARVRTGSPTSGNRG